MLMLIKNARIGQLSGGRWRVYSRTGKNLGTYSSRKAAEERLKEVEMFKHMDKKKRKKALEDMVQIIKNNSSDVVKSYSIIMRELNKQDRDKAVEFMKSFKVAFDQAIEQDLEDPEKVALLEAIQSTGESCQ